MFPAIVGQLAATVNGTPLSWKEYDDKWVIVMLDGRKFTFKKEEPEKPRAQETAADYHAGAIEPPRHRRRKDK